jgi:hypothetical protein
MLSIAAYEHITLYINLFCLLLLRRVKNDVRKQRKMDSCRDRDGNHVGLRGWGLHHGRHYKKSITYNLPVAISLQFRSCQARTCLFVFLSLMMFQYLLIYLHFQSKHKMFSYISTEDISCDQFKVF